MILDYKPLFFPLIMLYLIRQEMLNLYPFIMVKPSIEVSSLFQYQAYIPNNNHLTIKNDNLKKKQLLFGMIFLGICISSPEFLVKLCLNCVCE